MAEVGVDGGEKDGERREERESRRKRGNGGRKEGGGKREFGSDTDVIVEGSTYNPNFI